MGNHAQFHDSTLNGAVLCHRVVIVHGRKLKFTKIPRPPIASVTKMCTLVFAVELGTDMYSFLRVQK
jgi:hypothetical protein